VTVAAKSQLLSQIRVLACNHPSTRPKLAVLKWLAVQARPGQGNHHQLATTPRSVPFRCTPPPPNPTKPTQTLHWPMRWRRDAPAAAPSVLLHLQLALLRSLGPSRPRCLFCSVPFHSFPPLSRSSRTAGRLLRHLTPDSSFLAVGCCCLLRLASVPSPPLPRS